MYDDLEFVAVKVSNARTLGVVRMSEFRVREVINDFGDWSGVVELDANDKISQLDLTDPWKVRIYVVLGGQPVYALDVWTRERSLGEGKLRLGGKLTGSWLERVTIGGRHDSSLVWENEEQQQIARELVWHAVYEWTSGWAGFSVYIGQQGTKFRDKSTWDAADNKPYGEALRDLANLQDGFQFRFEPRLERPGEYMVEFRTGYPYLQSADPIVAEYTADGNGGYTGNVRGLAVSESVAAYATDVIVWGSGEGASKLRGKAHDASLNSVMPAIVRTENRNDVITQSWLTERAQTILSASDTPMYPPTIYLAADDPLHPVGSYAVGDRIRVQVDPTPEFPNGLSGEWRIFETEYVPDRHGAEMALVVGDGGQ